MTTSFGLELLCDAAFGQDCQRTNTKPPWTRSTMIAPRINCLFQLQNIFFLVSRRYN